MVKLFSDEWIEENCAEYRPLNMRMRREMTMGRMNIKPPRNLATFISSVPMSDKQKEVMLIRGRAMASRANIDRDVRNMSRDPVVNPRQNFSLLPPRYPPVSSRIFDMDLEKQAKLMKIVGNSIKNLGIRLDDPELLMMEAPVSAPMEAPVSAPQLDKILSGELPSEAQVPPPRATAIETNIVRTAMETGIGTDVVPIPSLPIDKAPQEVVASLRGTIRQRYTPEDMERTRVRQNRLVKLYQDALDVKTEILMSEALVDAGATLVREEFKRSADSQREVIESIMTQGRPDSNKIKRLNNEQLRNAKGVIMKNLHIKTPELEQINIRPESSDRDKLIIEIITMLNPAILEQLSPTSGKGNLKDASDRRIRRFDIQFDDLTRKEYRQNLNAILGQDQVNKIVESQRNIGERISQLESQGFTTDEAEDIIRREIQEGREIEQNKGGLQTQEEIAQEILDEYLFEPDADGNVVFEDILREAYREEEVE